MAIFATGQRWINENELERGLGTLLKVEKRKITLFYPATGETRLYQMENTPLHRMVFSKGDEIRNHDGLLMTVTEIREENYLLNYVGVCKDTGKVCEIPESTIEGQITFSKPGQRLLAGQIGKNSEFNLRYQALEYYQSLSASSLLGLCGSRISLVPHQLHIAHEVGNRFAPRVLLADEAGLGKTIEAGLVLNRQLLTGKINRVLVIVPESLVHQWLVEMLRRFNLRFTLFNDERYQAISEENPFETAQLIITSMESLRKNKDREESILQASWDMLVIDEAHHLQWSEAEGGSPEYCLVEKLANKTPGVLLLTATPEQLGQEGHFARLRLLDKACFPSLENFLRQEADYQSVVKLAECLTISEKINALQEKGLFDLLGKAHADDIEQMNAEDEQVRSAAKDRLVQGLLDRYGIGRVLFRNSRYHVKGFPGRVAQGYPLETPELYRIVLESSKRKIDALYPEILYPSVINDELAEADPWWKVDPRIEWLDQIARLVKDKILVICANASTAMEIENSLRISGGHHVAVFHENMNIIERDRAAAWFTEEHGAHLLVCSEIGSEGRNFQAAHHLVLFDLPYNPDLLEQRIGRLDRIGQKEVIKIHVPYLKETAQENLFHWYDNGLDAFNRYCASASKVFYEKRDEVDSWVFDTDGAEVAFIEETRKRVEFLNKKLEEGRDVLIELGSSGKADGLALKKAIIEQECIKTSRAFVERLFECFGIDIEDRDEQSLIIHPGNHMRVSAYPGLGSESMAITFDRETALSREDMTFVSGEHPLVREGIELLTGSDIGNTAVALLKNKNLPEGTMLLEAVFIVEPEKNKNLHLETWMPPTIIHTLVDPAFNNLAGKVKVKSFHSHLKKVKNAQAKKLVRAKRQAIAEMLKKAEGHAKKSLIDIVNQASVNFVEKMGRDIHRLATLKAVNPNIRDDEIRFLVNLAARGQEALKRASLKLDSVRLVVTMR